MENRNMGFGGHGFGSGSEMRNKLHEEWQKMPVEDKVKFMDEKMKFFAGKENHMGGFFGGHHGTYMSERVKKWEGMSFDEKVAFVTEREEAMKEGKCMHHHGHHHPFGNKDFSVEEMDRFCEEWLKKPAEEKEEFVRMRKEMFAKRMAFMGGFFGNK